MLLSNRTFSGSDWPLCHHRTSSGNARCQKSSELGQKKKKKKHYMLNCAVDLRVCWRRSGGQGGFGKEGEESTVGVNGM